MLRAWRAKEVLVLKRSLSAGYARLHNPIQSSAASPPLPRFLTPSKTPIPDKRTNKHSR